MGKFKKKNRDISKYVKIILFSIVISFLPIGNTMISLRILGVACLVECITFLIFNKRAIGSAWNFSTLFVLILFVFHFGQLMIFSFLRFLYHHVRFLNLMEAEDALYGFRFMNIAFCAVCLGILFSNVLTDASCKKQKVVSLHKEYDWEKIAKIVIALTFPVKIILDMMTMLLTFTEGGVAARAWVNSFPNVILYYGKISLVGFALLLLALQKKEKEQTKLFVFVELYLMFAMISGIRSENVSYVCVFALLYFMSSKKNISIKQWIYLGVIAILGLTFIVTVGGFRNAEEKNVITFFQMFFKYLFQKNVILYLMDTCGDTGYTAICVLTKWLKQYSPSWGNAYYLGWLAIIPSLFGIAGKLTAESCFMLKLQEYDTLYDRYKNIGGSLLGEQFFNFHIVGGILACFLIGMMIGWTSKKCYQAIKNENFIWMPLAIPIMFTSVYWVRNYFGGGIREVVWGAVFCWLVAQLYTFFLKQKNKRVN